MPKLTYKSSGVNYDLLDKLKRLAQDASGATLDSMSTTGFKLDKNSVGESAQIFEFPGVTIASVQEGLGTKNLVADEMENIDKSKHWYSGIAQDTVAMIINDLITVGALPVNVSAYWGIGSSKWLEDECKMQDLVAGWKDACMMADALWVGGETPMLTGIINDNTVDLAGVAFGVIAPLHKNYVVTGEQLSAGDAIVVFESSGIHANGITLARKLAESLPEGYKTKINDTEMFGEALLKPTIIYAKLIQDLFKKDISIHYMANITGHGWRKLMRNSKKFTYRIKSLPPVPEVLTFIQKEAELDDTEAYGNLNMGAGFAIFVPQEYVQSVIDIAKKQEKSIKAYHVGQVEEGEKQVIIEPKNITFAADTLQVKA